MSILKILGFKPYSKVNDQQAEAFAKQLKRKLDKGDYADCEIILAKSSDQNRERLIYGIASSENSVPLSAEWVRKHPNSAFANVLLGASLIVSGWEIRGSGYAKDVDKHAWAPFLSKLESAEEPLYKAAQLDKSIAEPYSWLIHAGLGQGAPKEYLYELFEEATSRAPLHWPAYCKYFSAVTQKWGGSHDEMFAFVREITKIAPQGNILHCLVPKAYNEIALSITSDRGASAAYTTLRQSQYAKEIVSSLYSWLDATPDTLQNKLANLNDGFASFVLNQFGVALYIAGAQEEAKAVLYALNGEIESVPWAWISKSLKGRFNPAFVYDRACKQLGIPLPQQI